MGKLWVQNVLLWGGPLAGLWGVRVWGIPASILFALLSLERFVCLLILLFVAFRFELKLGAETGLHVKVLLA